LNFSGSPPRQQKEGLRDRRSPLAARRLPLAAAPLFGPQRCSTENARIHKMGWWPFGGRGGDLTASKIPDPANKRQQAAGVSTAATATAARAAAAAADPSAEAARPTSVFAFGPIVGAGGEVLRGMCAGDDPDAIQACTWTIEKAETAPRPKMMGGKAHAYVVEF